jgi:hypothetical protein
MKRSALLGSLAVPELEHAPDVVDPILDHWFEKLGRARKLLEAGDARAKALQSQWLSRPPQFFHIKNRVQ